MPVTELTVPVDGATNVELQDILSATFSEAIANDSVNNSNFQLSLGGNGVAGTVILDDANNTAKFGPVKTLALLRDYTATLTDCITNLSGTPLPASSWSFTSRDGTWNPIGSVLGKGNRNPIFYPDIATNANGEAVAVWVEDTGSRTDIWSSRYSPDSGWSIAELVETETTYSSVNPRVALDDTGNAIAVWQMLDVSATYSIMASRYEVGSGWGAAEALETGTGYAGEQRVVANAAGDAIVVWSQADEFDVYGIWSNHFDVDNGWSGAELIVYETDTNATEPEVAINEAGVGFAAWGQATAPGGAPRIWVARYLPFPVSGWGSQDVISVASDQWAFAPEVYVDSAGEVTVVWMQDDGSEDFLTHIWANRYAEDNSYRDYYYSGTNFIVQSGSRFSESDSISGYFRVDCGLAGGTGDCKSLPQANYTGALTDCSFTASGSPPLTITCADFSSAGLLLTTDANGQPIPQYSLWLESSLEGGDGARIEFNHTGSFVEARAGAAGGEGVAYTSGGSLAAGSVSLNWGTAGLLETDEFSYAGPPRIAGNPDGSVIAVWQQDDELEISPVTFEPLYSIWANRFSKGSGWSGPEIVQTSPEDGDTFSPEVAIDAAGNAMAVWESNGFSPRGIFASRYLPGAGWDSPTAVGEINYFDVSGPYTPGDASFAESSRTQIAADGFGNMHLVWQRLTLDPQIGNVKEGTIQFSRFGGGGEPNAKLITETSFADSVLRDCIISAAAANSWHFPQEVTSLNCSNLDIQSLVGMENFVNLVTLNLSGNPIGDLSIIIRFPDLRELYLANNPVLTDISALLAQGQLTTVDLSGSGDGNISCPDLDALGPGVTHPADCRKTPADVTFADSVLQTCVANSVKEQMVTFLDELTILNCERRDGLADIGRIMQLDGIDILENLEVINIDRSGVDDLTPLSGMDTLKRIDASSTEVYELDAIAALPNLEVLVLKTAARLYNDLDNPVLPTGISILGTMPALREVYLDEKGYCAAGSGAQCWTGRGRLDCQTLDDLEVLFDDPESPRIFVRPASCNMPLADALAEVPDVNLRNCLQERADLDGWTDTFAFGGFLSCEARGVTDLSGMENFSRLLEFDMDSNPVSDLTPLNSIYTLQKLYLSGTDVTSFDALTNLTRLRTVIATYNPGMTDLSQLLGMTWLGKVLTINSILDPGFVALSESGSGNIACDAVDLLEAVVTGNGGVFYAPTNCGGPPAIPPSEGRLTDMNADGADDLILQFEEPEGVPLTANWTTALSASPVFDEFSNLPGYDTAVYSRARAIGLADADNDDVDDMLLQLDSATDDSIVLQVKLNDGSGNFTQDMTPLVIPDGSKNNAQAIGFTDVNNDGLADILVQWQAPLAEKSFAFYYLYLNTGSGFVNASPIDVWQKFFELDKVGRPRLIALEDVNDDGYADLVYANVGIATESNQYPMYCFTVSLWDSGTSEFDGRGSPTRCDGTDLRVGPRNFLDSASVADVTGNGRKELVLSFNLERNLERIGDITHSIGLYKLKGEPSGRARWSDLTSLAEEWSDTNLDVVTNYHTVAVADINDDRRSDVIVEKEVEGSGKTWIAFLSGVDGSGDVALVRDISRIPTPSLSDEYMLIGLLDYNDDDLQNLPDLLFRRMNMTTGLYEIRVGTNNGAVFGNSALWWSGTEMPGIIGLEEDGLTALANDTSELLAWSGDTRLQTRGEFKSYLLSKGYELLEKTVLDLDPDVGPNKCVLGYGDADASGTDSVDGFNQYRATGKMALLACNYQVGTPPVIKLKMQAVYGGCAGTAGVAGAGAKCEAGVFKASTEFIISDEPPVNVEAAVSGPRVKGCAEVTLTNFCAGAEASLADASVGAEVGGVGASTGVSAGSFGGRLQGGWEDGAITASVGIEFILGVEFEVSVNPEEVGKTFILVGETSYTWGNKGAKALGEGGEFVIYTAGPAVYDTASKGAKAGSKIAKTVAGDAVNFFAETTDVVANTTEQAYFIFTYVQDQAIEEIFDELRLMQQKIIDGDFDDYVSGKLFRVGEAAYSAAKSFWRYVSKLF